MDLFPKEYKKNGFSPTMNRLSSGMGFSWADLRSKFFGGGFSSVSSSAKETLARLGVILSTGVFLLVLLLWSGLIFYGRSLTAQIGNLKKEQAAVFSAEDKEMAAKIVNFDENVSLLRVLLKNHIYSSAIFDKLASLTLPRVQWRTFNLSVKDSGLVMDGLAADYATLAKQMLALEEGGFTNLKISNISLDRTGAVAFTAAFNFDPKILQK